MRFSLLLSLSLSANAFSVPVVDTTKAIRVAAPPAGCKADLNGDGKVDGDDMAVLLIEMGCPTVGGAACQPGASPKAPNAFCSSTNCAADLNGNGRVDDDGKPGGAVPDITLMLAAYGPCTEPTSSPPPSVHSPPPSSSPTPTPTPSPTGPGRTFYVDFDSGDDTNDGLSAATPLKRAPHDPLAQHSLEIEDGDRVWFKGGVVYRGDIRVAGRATALKNVEIRGDKWGAGRAIIDGADPMVGTWTNVGGNVWSIPIPQRLAACQWIEHKDEGCQVFRSLYEGGGAGEMAAPAQTPTPSDEFHFSNWGMVGPAWRGWPANLTTIDFTRSQIVDPEVFGPKGDAKFQHLDSGSAYVGLHVNPNVVHWGRIVHQNAANGTIVFAPPIPTGQAPNKTYSGGNSYTLINHRQLLDTPGQYAWAFEEGKLFYRPRADGADPNTLNMVMSNRSNGIRLTDAVGATVGGLEMRNVYSGEGDWNEFVVSCHGGNNHGCTGFVVEDCELHHSRMMGQKVLSIGPHALVNNTYVHHNQLSQGDYLMDSDSVLSNSHFTACGRVCVAPWNVTNISIVRNRFDGVFTFHSQSLSLYNEEENPTVGALIAGNEFTQQCEEFTTNTWCSKNGCKKAPGSMGAVLYNNLFVSAQDKTIEDGGCGSHTWGAYDDLVLVNNAFMQGMLIDETSKGGTSVNNIINVGGQSPTHSHNLYTGLMWNQDGKEGWAPTGAGERGNMSCAVDRSLIFAAAPRLFSTMRRRGTGFACGHSVVCLDAQQYGCLVAAGDTLRLHPHGEEYTITGTHKENTTDLVVTTDPPVPPSTLTARDGISWVEVWPKGVADRTRIDYNLSATSLALDAGSSAEATKWLAAARAAFDGVYDFDKDVYGNARVAGGEIDIGPIEGAAPAMGPCSGFVGTSWEPCAAE